MYSKKLLILPFIFTVLVQPAARFSFENDVPKVPVLNDGQTLNNAPDLIDPLSVRSQRPTLRRGLFGSLPVPTVSSSAAAATNTDEKTIFEHSTFNTEDKIRYEHIINTLKSILLNGKDIEKSYDKNSSTPTKELTPTKEKKAAAEITPIRKKRPIEDPTEYNTIKQRRINQLKSILTSDAEALLKRLPCVCLKRTQQPIPLHIIDFNDINGALNFIAQGYDINAQYTLEQAKIADDESAEGRTALQHAIIKNNWPMVCLLLLCNADVNILDRFDENALHYVINSQNFDLEVFEFICKKTKNINKINLYGNNALHLAIKNSIDVKAIQLLLNSAIDINAFDHDRNTALILAVDSRDSDKLIELLLQFRPNIILKNNNLCTFLDCINSAFSPNSRKAKNAFDKFNSEKLEQLLSFAGRNEDIQKCIELLIQYPYLVDACNVLGINLIQEALININFDLIKQLFEDSRILIKPNLIFQTTARKPNNAAFAQERTTERYMTFDEYLNHLVKDSPDLNDIRNYLIVKFDEQIQTRTAQANPSTPQRN